MKRKQRRRTPLMGIFPLGFDFDHETEQATLAYYLKMAKRYIGSPMLSALYGVWAARSGNRKLSSDLLDRGYGDFCTDRFMRTLEYRKDIFPEQPPAGPFFANLGGFLLGLIAGFPKIQPGPADPQEWCKGQVVLPAGWRSIQIDRVWIRGKPWRLSAIQGEASPARATLNVHVRQHNMPVQVCLPFKIIVALWPDSSLLPDRVKVFSRAGASGTVSNL